MHANELANVNGAVTPIDRACIPAIDHGFLYGDGVYETIRTYERRPFSLSGHLERLERSAAAIRLVLPWSREEVGSAVAGTLASARASEPLFDGEFAIRIMVTRGTGPLGYDPELCPRPSLVVLVTRLRETTEQEREVGVPAVIASIRRNPIEALDPRIKSSNLLNNILAAQQARDAGAVEAILFSMSGFLAEGTLSNVFFVKDGRVMTPSIDCGILSGITREILLDILDKDGRPAAIGCYQREELASADEIFLTSTTREILPVATLDGRAVGAGGRGPVTQRLQALFRHRVAELLRAETSIGKG